jgi:hypothetical protein
MSGESGRPYRSVPYSALNYIAVALIASAAVALALAIAEPAIRGMLATMVACICLAAIIIATTAGLRRMDDVIANQAVLAYDMRRIVAYAERNLGASLDIADVVSKVNGRVDAMSSTWDSLGRRELGVLRAEMDTLAEMITERGGLTLDVDSGDVYELGKRVGREETLRELGKDQIP